jgi:formate hydrogenlyase subunit 3/multisubunit Na+/H+ antiporter MnhD subunit
MLILVTADNFVQMFVGWEGVGLCSYLLINFWFTRIQANKAAIKAMILNRIGDFGLVLGILVIFVSFKAVDYGSVFSLAPLFVGEKFNFLNFNFDLLNVIGVLLFIGAIGKSAQLGLHTWLPDAMEGFSKGLSLNSTICGNILKLFWSTQDKFLFGKIQIKGQSAGNQILSLYNKVGSSETTRGTLKII